jgi:hypothetical protein
LIIYYNRNKLLDKFYGFPTKGGFVQGNRFPGFNEIISGTPKKSEKEMGSVFKNERFIKRPILYNFCKSNEIISGTPKKS